MDNVRVPGGGGDGMIVEKFEFKTDRQIRASVTVMTQYESVSYFFA